MNWQLIQNAKVFKCADTGTLGIQCCPGEDVTPVGNQWRDVTGDFTWEARVVPMSCAVVAGNNVLHLNAEMQLTEEISGVVRFVTTTKWTALIETNVPVMVVHTGGTVTMCTAYYNAYGYVSMDFTGISTSDTIYVDMVVPVQ